MCVALREGRTQTAADPNTIKMDRVFVSVCMCVSVRATYMRVVGSAGLVTITRPWTSWGRLPWKCALWAHEAANVSWLHCASLPFMKERLPAKKTLALDERPERSEGPWVET